jgi:hypothetical protein
MAPLAWLLAVLIGAWSDGPQCDTVPAIGVAQEHHPEIRLRLNGRYTVGLEHGQGFVVEVASCRPFHGRWRPSRRTGTFFSP